MGSVEPPAPRGQSTVVGKALEAGIVVLFVTLLTTALFGGAVPAYRSTAAQAVADRTLAAAAQHVQGAVPPDGRAVDARVRVSLPATIAGDAYRIRTDGRALELVHPRPGVGGRVRLAVPASVTRVEGTWTGGGPTRVRVTGPVGDRVVRLEGGAES